MSLAGGSAPDPAAVRDLDDFIDAFGRLRSWAGSPTPLDLVTAAVRALGLDEPLVAQRRAACVRAQTAAETRRPQRRSGRTPSPCFEDIEPDTKASATKSKITAAQGVV